MTKWSRDFKPDPLYRDVAQDVTWLIEENNYKFESYNFQLKNFKFKWIKFGSNFWASSKRIIEYVLLMNQLSSLNLFETELFESYLKLCLFLSVVNRNNTTSTYSCDRLSEGDKFFSCSFCYFSKFSSSYDNNNNSLDRFSACSINCCYFNKGKIAFQFYFENIFPRQLFDKKITRLKSPFFESPLTLKALATGLVE